MMTILLGLSVFAACVILLGLGLMLRGRPLAGGCHAACALTGRCPHPTRDACTSARERGHGR